MSAHLKRLRTYRDNMTPWEEAYALCGGLAFLAVVILAVSGLWIVPSLHHAALVDGAADNELRLALQAQIRHTWLTACVADVLLLGISAYTLGSVWLEEYGKPAIWLKTFARKAPAKPKRVLPSQVRSPVVGSKTGVPQKPITTKG
jgi:hypothetical protein